MHSRASETSEASVRIDSLGVADIKTGVLRQRPLLFESNHSEQTGEVGARLRIGPIVGLYFLNISVILLPSDRFSDDWQDSVSGDGRLK